MAGTRVPLATSKFVKRHKAAVAASAIATALLAFLAVRDDIDRRLAQYARLDPVGMRAVGADRFPPAPLPLLINADG